MYMLVLLVRDWEPIHRAWAIVMLVLWFYLARLTKLIEHFVRYPCDLPFLILVPFIGYFHSLFIKLPALFTLDRVSTLSGAQSTQILKLCTDELG